MCSAGALICLALVTAETLATPRPAQLEAGRPAIEIVEQNARWMNLLGPDELSGDGASFYVVSGTLRNSGPQPVGHVKLGFDLIDADGVVVASEYGYNRRAEDLRLPEYEEGKIARSDLRIPALGAGESDGFRMMFIRGTVPPFSTWSVRVLEVGN